MSGIGGIMGLAVSGGQTSGQQFLTSGTFNIPSGIQFLEVLLVGGGGSGGKYTWNSTYSVASGGGAGEILFGKIYVAGLTQIAVTIGAGGQGMCFITNVEPEPEVGWIYDPDKMTCSPPE